MEKKRVKVAIRCFHRSDRRGCARRRHRKPRRHRIHVVAMARPHTQLGRNLLEQFRHRPVAGHANIRVAELTLA
jgi:hypothetical protein